MALVTLFEISTTEAWTAVTYAAVDSTEEDMQPIRDNALMRAWFFILFMMVGAYLVVNLFVGVVVDNFKKVRAWPMFLSTRRRGGGGLGSNGENQRQGHLPSPTLLHQMPHHRSMNFLDG